MIPKKIHYCWFGGKPLPQLAEKCINSWKKYCPDYEIIEWNETNYNLKSCIYVEEAYKAQRWAFVSDFARLDIIYNYGGIYLDIDVELLKNLDELLKNKEFFATEQVGLINTGLIFGAEIKNSNIKLLLEEYTNIHFIISENVYDVLPCPQRNTHPFLNKGFQKKDEIQIINEAVIFPPEYFCPIDNKTKKCRITSNTYSIHHFGALWISEDEKKIYKQFEVYDKNYTKIIAMLLKARYEYEITYDKLKMKFIFKFIKDRIKKRKIRKR